MSRLPEGCDSNAQLPAFVLPLRSDISTEGLSYLNAKGALALPSIELQNALLEAYVEYAYPTLPLIDIHSFLGSVNYRNGLNGQVSLLIYNAVMLSGAAFVKMEALRDAGFGSRKCARRAFSQKIRLLYDFDYERDSLVLIQALLLMSPWCEIPDDHKDNWYWVGIAIATAYTIGLHRDPATLSMPPSKKKLRKRIWWSCIMMDRLLTLGTSRPLRIKDEDSAVPMIQEDDFKIHRLSNDITVISPDCRVMRDIGIQQELATNFVNTAKFALRLSHMLKS